MDNQYDESQILKLTPREHIRMRTKMYLEGGVTSQGLHETVFNVIENAVIKVLNGSGNHIHVLLHNAHTITIEDFCVDSEPYINENAGKGIAMWEWEQTSPKHTRYVRHDFIGIADALSAKMDIQVRHHGEVWEYHAMAGLATHEPKITRLLTDGELTGTKITFIPDFEVFEKNDFQPNIIKQRLWELSFLLPNVTFSFEEHISSVEGTKASFLHPNGLIDYIQFINRDKRTLHDPIYTQIHEEITDRHWSFNQVKDIQIQFVFQYVDDFIFYPLNYVNTEELSFDGIEKRAFMDSLKLLIGNKAQINQTGWLTTPEIMYGLVIVMSIFHPAPNFGRAIKWSLINSEVGDLISSALHDKFQDIQINDQPLLDILRQKMHINHHYYNELPLV